MSKIILLRILAALGLLGMLACINSPTPKLVPMPPKEPTAEQWPAVEQRVARADGVYVGTIAKIDEDWLYDDICGVVAIAMHKCDGTVTYRLTIAPQDTYLWAFVPAYGTFGLFVGESAVWVWRRDVAYRYQECRQHAGMSGYCGYDILPMLTSDLDVLPAADSARVDSLFNARPR